MTTGDPLLDAAEFELSLPNIVTYVTSLWSGSAASGAGNSTNCAGFPILNLDQRGFQRPAGEANCDIGAYESQLVPEPTANLAAVSLLSLVALRTRRSKRID